MHFRNCDDRVRGLAMEYNNNGRESRAILLFQRLRARGYFFLSLFFSPLSPRLVGRLVHVAHVRYSRCERARHVGRCAHCATDTDTTIHNTCPSVRPARSINVREKNDIVVLGLDHLADGAARPAQGRILSFRIPSFHID